MSIERNLRSIRGPILAGKDFVPKVEDFFHKAFDFSPNVGYLAHREDSDLESLETVWPEVADKQHMD